MHEFNNRIAAQRHVLQIVNRRGWPKEDLFGLSQKALDRWVTANHIEPTSQLVGLVTAASEKLFFLANKSQEQVSKEYASVSGEISNLAGMIEAEIAVADKPQATRD